MWDLDLLIHGQVCVHQSVMLFSVCSASSCFIYPTLGVSAAHGDFRTADGCQSWWAGSLSVCGLRCWWEEVPLPSSRPRSEPWRVRGSPGVLKRPNQEHVQCPWPGPRPWPELGACTHLLDTGLRRAHAASFQNASCVVLCGLTTTTGLCPVRPSSVSTRPCGPAGRESAEPSWER